MGLKQKKSKWLTQKKWDFQLPQFSIFFSQSQFFWVSYFEFFFFKKNFFLLHLNENKQPVHMRYHLFLNYGLILQNLGKDFIPTNMHTTVYTRARIINLKLRVQISNFKGAILFISKTRKIYGCRNWCPQIWPVLTQALHTYLIWIQGNIN